MEQEILNEEKLIAELESYSTSAFPTLDSYFTIGKIAQIGPSFRVEVYNINRKKTISVEFTRKELTDFSCFKNKMATGAYVHLPLTMTAKETMFLRYYDEVILPLIESGALIEDETGVYGLKDLLDDFIRSPETYSNRISGLDVDGEIPEIAEVAIATLREGLVFQFEDGAYWFRPQDFLKTIKRDPRFTLITEAQFYNMLEFIEVERKRNKNGRYAEYKK